MMTPFADRPITRRQKTLEQRLRRSSQQYENAERARLQAILAAHDADLSLRHIADAAGLSRSRIHQLVKAPGGGLV